nr:hypothetical protein [Tanacetum cinerariifolium]
MGQGFEPWLLREEKREFVLFYTLEMRVLGEYNASALLTPLVKLGGGIRPIAVGTVWRRLVSKEDPRSRRAGIFPPNIARPLLGVKLLGGAASVDFDFCNELVMKRVANTNGLIDSIAKINDPQCELFLLRSCIPLFSVLKPCSACSMDFTEDIYGLHVVSRARIIGIKHRYNVVRDTLVDICYRSGISVGKEVDIEMDGGRDKPLHFVSGRAMIDVVERKHFKFMAKCVSIGYGFLPFSFSYLGELEEDAVTLLKRIRKVSMAKDIRARVVVHIFNRIGFAIARGVGAQLVSQLFTNFL